MSHGSVERKTLRFPGKNTFGDVVACGVPGPASSGGAAVSRDGTESAYVNPADVAGVKITLPLDTNTKGPVVAIGIAPDSAIHTCDISLGGKDGEGERHRISPGNPLLGCMTEADFAIVTIPNAVAGIVLDASQVAWDAVNAPLPGDTPGEIFLVPGYPLRLEIWRGGVAPIRSPKRAGYFAHAVLNLHSVGGGGAVDKDFFVCVDGRSKIDVTVSVDVAVIEVTMYSVEAAKVSGALESTQDDALYVPLALDESGVLVAAVAAGSAQIFSFNGNPITLLRVNVSVAGGGFDVNAQIHVRAWD